MTVTVRPVLPADREAWVVMKAALWPDHTQAEHEAEAAAFFGQTVRRPGVMPEEVLVAVAPNGNLVGFAELSRRLYAEGCSTSPVGFLEGWYVVAEFRRHGVGRALVAAAEAWARSLGCTEFASDALADNAVSEAAHKAIGFEEVEVIRCFRKALDG